MSLVNFFIILKLIGIGIGILFVIGYSIYILVEIHKINKQKKK